METNEEKFDAFLTEARDYITGEVSNALSGLFAAKQDPKPNNGGPRPPESQNTSPANTPPTPPVNNSGTGGNGNSGGSSGGEKGSGASRRWFGDRA